MGRRPKPAEIRAAQGNPGKRPLPAAPAAAATDTAAATAADPAAPGLPDVADDRLPPELKGNEAASRAWREVAPMLAQMRLFRATDRHALVRYCARVGDWLQLRADLAGEGMVYETDSRHGKMMRINPRFMVLERTERALVDLEDRFGLNPAARQKILASMATHQPSLPLESESPATPRPPSPDAEGRAPSPVGALSHARVH